MGSSEDGGIAGRSPCLVCGTPTRGAYCPAHDPGPARRKAREKAHGRHTAAWQRTRKAVLDRDGHLCRIRLAGCTVRATTVHRLPEWGQFHDENLAAYVSACRRCHGAVDGPRAQKGE